MAHKGAPAGRPAVQGSGLRRSLVRSGVPLRALRLRHTWGCPLALARGSRGALCRSDAQGVNPATEPADMRGEGEEQDVGVKLQSFVEKGVRVWVLHVGCPAVPGLFIAAEATVMASPEEVFKLVTDYERYTDILPNVAYTRVKSRRRSGATVFMKAALQSIYWRAEADTLLRMTEEEDEVLQRKQVAFNQLEGGFETFQGSWSIQGQVDCENSCETLLRFELEVESKGSLVPSIVDHIIREKIPENLHTLVKKAEHRTIGGRKQIARLPTVARQDAPGTPTAHQYLGVYDVPIPGAQQRTLSPAGVRAAPPVPPMSSYPPIRLGGPGASKPTEVVQGVEVHLRRLDDDEYLHTRAVASIELDAPPERVWDLLTDYERLPTVLPNLAISERINDEPAASTSATSGARRRGRAGQAPSRADRAGARLVQLRQVVYKQFLYLHLRAEAVLDCLEKRKEGEIQFKLRKGMFDRLQGKFLIHPLQQEGGEGSVGGTKLVYAVEIRAPKGLHGAILEPIIEHIAFIDMPANLAAMRTHLAAEVEAKDTGTSGVEVAKKRGRLSVYDDPGAPPRPASAVLCSDFDVFREELLRTFGRLNKTMPKKEEFRTAGRFDLEKACYAHGGFANVAQRVGWKLQYQRKPKDYWMSYENLRGEILAFIQDNDLDPNELPSRRIFIDLDRADIARAFTKWGGQAAVAESMGLKAPPSSQRQQNAWQQFCDSLADETGLEGQDLFDLAKRRYEGGDERSVA